MASGYLINAPLKEVLIELHWDLDFISEEGIEIDSSFEKAVIKFTQGCQQEYQVVTILKPANIPPTAYPHRVTHRFQKVLGQHPLYQMGPGVFTINDNNKNYKWVDFRQMIEFGINCLQESYDRPLVLSKVELRYVDRVSPFIFEDSDKFSFIGENFGINPSQFQVGDNSLTEFQILQRFQAKNDSILTIILTTGLDQESRDELIEWHTFVTNTKRLSWESLLGWIETAHNLCSTTFKNMLSSKLYEYFSK